MFKAGLRRRAVTLSSAIAGVMLLGFAASPNASADTMRTLNLTLTCATGLPYGLLINNGSGWYSPDAPGTTYASGTTKYYTVYIPASAGTLEFQPTYCDNQPPYNLGGSPQWEGYSYGISPGTSTVNATGYVNDYSYSIGYGMTYLFYYCSINSLTYS
jgi:hypothetical protein